MFHCRDEETQDDLELSWLHAQFVQSILPIDYFEGLKNYDRYEAQRHKICSYF